MDITPDKQNIDRVFSNTSYQIDFYQREYKWGAEPVQRLLDDIFYGFEEAYSKKGHLDPSPENITVHYPWYYLNTYVTNTVGGRVYLVDGQQRLTTLTLLLIKLYHLAQTFESELQGWISGKIGGRSGYEQKFWMNHELHTGTLEDLLKDEKKLDSIDVSSGITAENMVANYEIIKRSLEKNLSNKGKFETFVFYFLNRLVLVNLSVEQTDVPMVFEVINDRGVRLKPYEILKGKLLGQIDKQELENHHYNDKWEQQVALVNAYSRDEIDNFFRYFLKAKFSNTRNLGQRFDGDYHREIFKDDLDESLQLEHNPNGVKKFLLGAFRYYTSLYAKILSYRQGHDGQRWVHLNTLNEMDSQFLLILSACKIDDPEEEQKISEISRHLDRLFSLLRLQRAYDSNVFNDEIFDISESIRDQDLGAIAPTFEAKLISMLSENRNQPVTESFQYAYFRGTSISDMPARFTRYFFARVDDFLAREMNLGMKHPIDELVTRTGSKTGFHIEHVLSNNRENLSLYDNDEEEFDQDRNRLGAVLLLKGKDNQSSNKERYKDKLKTYANTLYWNETLRKDSYKSKLDMRQMIKKHDLRLEPLDNFGPKEVELRQRQLFKIASIIWRV